MLAHLVLASSHRREDKMPAPGEDVPASFTGRYDIREAVRLRTAVASTR